MHTNYTPEFLAVEHYIIQSWHFTVKLETNLLNLSVCKLPTNHWTMELNVAANVKVYKFFLL